MGVKRCEFCGSTDSVDHLWGAWICDDPECEEELREALEWERQREHNEVDERYGF